MNKQKGLAPILIVLLLALGIGGYLIYQKQTKSIAVPQQATQSTAIPSSSPESTNSAETANPNSIVANWKTYTNTKYGFSFQYPASFKLSGSQNEDIQMNVVNSTSEKCLNGETIDLFSVNYGQYQPTSISKYQSSNTFSPNAQFKEAIFGSDKAVQSYYAGSSQTGGPQVALFFVHNGQGYQIVYRFCANPGTILNDSQISNMNPDILSTFKFIDQKQVNKTSPDGSYIVIEEILGDYNKITIKDNKNNIVVDDLLANNSKEIGYNVKFKCQCGTSFKRWIDNSVFSIKIINGGGEEYEYLVDARSGKVNESSFKKIK